MLGLCARHIVLKRSTQRLLQLAQMHVLGLRFLLSLDEQLEAQSGLVAALPLDI